MTKKQAFAVYPDNPRIITEQEAAQLKTDLAELGDLGGIVHDLNSNQVCGGHQRLGVMFGRAADGFKIESADIQIIKEYKTPTRTHTVAEGFIVWEGERFAYRQVRFTTDQFKRANVIANLRGGNWSYELLRKQFSPSELQSLGFNDDLIAQLKSDATALEGMLHDKAVLPEKNISLQPKFFVRVLVSIPVDMSIDAKKYLDQLAAIDGIEIDYGAN